jgi:hypothetical protein
MMSAIVLHQNSGQQPGLVPLQSNWSPRPGLHPHFRTALKSVSATAASTEQLPRQIN